MTQIPMDAVGENGQADVAEATTDEFELGSDLLEDIGEVDKPETEAPEKAESTPEAESPTQEPINLDTVDPETLPPELQKMARELKADHTRKTQVSAEELKQARALKDHLTSARLQALENQQQAGQQQAQADADPFADLRARLSPDEQNAVSIIDEVDRVRNGDFREQTNQKFDQMTAALQRVVQVMVGQMGQQAEVQAVSLRDKYPDIDSTAPQRAALVKVENPATGKAYTQEEAHRLVKGLAAQESQQLAQKDRVARRQPTTTPPAPRRASDAGGDFSDTELTEAMTELGFG